MNRTSFWRYLDPELEKQLKRPLQKGQNPALNIPLLHQAYGTDTLEELVCEMASGTIKIPAFMDETRPSPRRNRRGRPGISTLALEAAGVRMEGIPDWVDMVLKERFLAGMSAIREEAPKRIRPEHCARRVLRQETLLGWPNPYLLGQSAPREAVEKYAASFADAFTHPARLREQQESIILKMEREWPHWRSYQAILLDLFPFYFCAYTYGAEGSKIWKHLIRKCEINCAVMSIVKTVLGRENLANLLHASIRLRFDVKEENKDPVSFVFLRLPSWRRIAGMTAVPHARLTFDWRVALNDNPEPNGLQFHLSGPADGHTLSRLIALAR